MTPPPMSGATCERRTLAVRPPARFFKGHDALCISSAQTCSKVTILSPRPTNYQAPWFDHEPPPPFTETFQGQIMPIPRLRFGSALVQVPVVDAIIMNCIVLP